MSADPNQRLAWTVRDFAADLHAGESTVRRWIKDGTVPARKLGGTVLIPGDWVRLQFSDAIAEWSAQVASGDHAPPPELVSTHD